MILIAAADANWGIGKDGQLLAHISQDLKRFKEITTGNILLIGRKTLESFPNGRPLPGRENFVITRNPDYVCSGATICHSVEEAFLLAREKYPNKTVFTAGGGSIYAQCLPYCQKAYITKIHQVLPADTYLENLDNHNDWVLAEESPVIKEGGISFSYATYQRVF